MQTILSRFANGASISKYTGRDTIKVTIKATIVSFNTVEPLQLFGARSKAKTPKRVPNWTKKLVKEIFPNAEKIFKLIIWQIIGNLPIMIGSKTKVRLYEYMMCLKGSQIEFADLLQ